MLIGELSRRTGTPAKTIRYYESLGLLPRPRRARNGYRVYDASDAARLRFIRHNRKLGMSLEAIGSLLAYEGRDELACGEAARLMAEQLEAVEARIRELERVRDRLRSAFAAANQPQPCDCQQLQRGFKED
jgi:DNA-binding transcriptional MerR regulator